MRHVLAEKLMLLAIDPLSRLLSQEDVIEVFNNYDAVWLHDGDPKKPHAELASEKCSNGYFNCSQVLCRPVIAEILIRQLIQKLCRNRLFERVDWVIGSPYSGITPSYVAAEVLGTAHGFCEKDPDNPKKMIWKRWQIPKGAKVLQIEELITTLGTTTNIREAVEKGNLEPVEFLPIVGTLVHRPPKLPVTYNGLEVVSLVEKEVWAVDPAECPLCRQGSIRLKPKSHWAELTGK